MKTLYYYCQQLSPFRIRPVDSGTCKTFTTNDNSKTPLDTFKNAPSTKSDLSDLDRGFLIAFERAANVIWSWTSSSGGIALWRTTVYGQILWQELYCDQT